MDVAGGLSLVQTILQLLDSAVLKETRSVLGVKSQLHKLKKTMSTIDAILRDAEEQERLHHSHSSYPERDRLERLKEALYQADDLFDEVTTLAHRKKLMPGNYLSKEVSLFFSRFNQLRSAFIWSREIKSIRESLDDVVKDHQLAGGFRHSVVLEDSWVRNNPRETHSYVNLENDVIIGRDDDQRFLIDLLLDTTVEGNVSVVSIVGIGGLGKTTLAQLIFNDDKIKREFPLKMWVCVSENFNVKALAGQILTAATNRANPSDITMDQLQEKLRKELDRNKYLLVLDDVWNENSGEWRKLKTFLVGGRKGSRILVTTRSKQVAVVMGSCWTHELKGLSDEDSWNLFQRMTLEPGQHQIEANLVDIGKEIVRKCVNVPLAIRVVGSLLQGHGENRWRYLNNTDFASIKQDEINGIIPVLKISYCYLPFHLKSCFSYCAVYPKDYKIIKEELIYLWMAQGFIMPSDGESFEDAGDKYFEQLLQRCFFQDVELAKGTTNEIVSCKMHDLIHDLAKEVAGTDISSCNYSPRCFNEKTRHLFIDRTTLVDFAHKNKSTPEDLLGKLSNMQRMRTFQCTNYFDFPVKTFVGCVSKVKYLRVLRLNCEFRDLPSRISELVHLRYLDLSDNEGLCVLPSSITKLYNLQTLKLRGCSLLKRLPRELRKLVNLRHLDIYGCSNLTCMPPGMNSMAYLRNLTGFVVSGSDAWNSLPIQSYHHLSLLRIRGEQNVERLNEGEVGEVFRSGCLSSLRSLDIWYCSNLKSISGRGVWDQFTGLESLSLRSLPELELEDEDDVSNNKSTEESDAEMPWRYLAPSLRSLELNKLRKMVKLPRGIGCLSSLHFLKIEDCDNLESLTPSIGGLISLKSLKIIFCPELKAMPEEMRHLTSLTKLRIWACSSELMINCEYKNGATWSNIQHIPNIELD